MSDKKNQTISFIQMCLINIKSHYVNKEPDVWVFGAVRGEKYMDNAKYLFEYVNNNTSITAVWLSNSSEVISHLNQKGYKAFYMHSKEAMRYALKARVAIITHRGSSEKADLPFYAFSKKTDIIQLWHGMPLKKIAYDDKLYSFTHDESSVQYKIREKIKKIFFPFTQYMNTPSLMIALSTEMQNILAQAFRINKKNIAITGFPRNDYLIKTPEKKSTTTKIIYAPTFRNIEGSVFNIFESYEFKTGQIDTFLQDSEAELHIKLHPFNMPPRSLIKEINNAKNIKFFNNDDIYSELNAYSILITDYSSIYFDFLLTEKAIIFTPFDKETYLNDDRELYYDYDETTPGPQAKNWAEVINLIKLFLTTPDFYQKERIAAKERFHNMPHANFSETVYNEIKKLITSKP